MWTEGGDHGVPWSQDEQEKGGNRYSSEVVVKEGSWSEARAEFEGRGSPANLRVPVGPCCPTKSVLIAGSWMEAE